MPRTSDNGWEPNVARLFHDPGFRELHRLVEETRDKRMRSLTKELVSEEGVSEAKRQYERGYFSGMRRIFEIVEAHKEALSE